MGDPELHASCDYCWKTTSGLPDPATPGQTFTAEPVEAGPRIGRCCWCGQRTLSGIHVRLDPGDPQLMCGAASNWGPPHGGR